MQSPGEREREREREREAVSWRERERGSLLGEREGQSPRRERGAVSRRD